MPYKDPEAKRANDKAYYLANKERINLRNAQYRMAHLEQERAKNTAWQKANSEKSRAIKQKWKTAHPDKVKADQQRQRDNLSNNYLRRKISQHTTMKSGDIPQALVDAHRELLRLKRALRGGTKEAELRGECMSYAMEMTK